MILGMRRVKLMVIFQMAAPLKGVGSLSRGPTYFG